jgi:DNA-binding response OmpR family regulator
MTKRILVVEDDPSLSRVLRDNLLFENFEVELVADGGLVLEKAKAFGPDLIVLDISLPSVNGFDLCAALRKRGSVPILMLTARSQKADKLRGLNLGADDYITKPFDLEEFLARVKAILRRARPTSDSLVIGDVTIDFVSRTAHRGRTELHLTHREFEILQYLSERQGQVVHRDELLRELWGYTEAPFTRSVDNAILRLRKKIEPDHHRPHFIHTVHGDGYTLTPMGQGAEPILK